MPSELLFITCKKTEITLIDFSNGQQTLELVVSDCQVSLATYTLRERCLIYKIDNHMLGAPFPVLLSAPAEEPPNFFKLSLARSVTNSAHQNVSLQRIQYFSVLLRKLEIQMDENSLLRLLKFIDMSVVHVGRNNDSTIDPRDNLFLQPDWNLDDNLAMLYASLLHINPVSMRLTFLGNRDKQHISDSEVLDRTTRIDSTVSTH